MAHIYSKAILFSSSCQNVKSQSLQCDVQIFLSHCISNHFCHAVQICCVNGHRTLRYDLSFSEFVLKNME